MSLPIDTHRTSEYSRHPQSLLAATLGILLLGSLQTASAEILRVEITSVQSPTFGGSAFGAAGQYEKLVGKAFGQIDPNDPRNSVITDVALAPRNLRGMVEYSMDIYILRPIEQSKRSGRVLFEINNGGSKLSFRYLNDSASGGNDPTTAADAGIGFLMRQGYVIAWSGWDATVSSGNSNLTINVPVAKNLDGSSIVGPALEEFVIDNSTTLTGALTYPAATLDKSQTSLTVRNHYSDPPQTIAATDWEFVNAQSIRLLPPGTPFQSGTLYEFAYLATDPLVAGLGLAATRDFASYLRRGTVDGPATAFPLAGNPRFVYSFGVSQPARFMHDFLYLGFNEDEQGVRVFDGIFNWLAAGDGGFFNYRFAQPARTHRQHIGRFYPELQFPFTNQILTDPVSGQTDGRLRRCQMTDTCPKIFEANSANEYWAKAGSLLQTDSFGYDLNLDDAPDARLYLFSSLPHVAAVGPGICQQNRNPLVAGPGLRALLVALDEWVSWAVEPPASQVPQRWKGTLVPSLPHESVGFPFVPGIKYNGLLHSGDLLNFGPSFSQGILTTVPPVVKGSAYPVLVPRTDADGNDVAGIRLPEIGAPLATYTGWALRAGPAADDGCDQFGQQVPFSQTQAERLAKGDPRLSIEERYQNHDGYVSAVRKATLRLVRRRFLLLEDAEQYLRTAEASNVLR
jgi:hypothetical protein